MSLQVWLPLTKDLRQQGLSSMTVENHNATLNTVGKLGSCYYFNGSQQWLQLSNNLGNFYNNDWSVACWLKPTDSTRSIILSEYSGTGASNVAIELTTARIVRLYWNGSPDISFSTAGALPLNEWTHLVMAKQGRIVKLYFNGELKQTYINSSDFSTRISACQPRIGDDYRGKSGNSVSYQGYMNDFRLYDHCLSPMEVKELAKGLVLHYPLNRNGWGQDNLLLNSSIEKTGASNSAQWFRWNVANPMLSPNHTYTLSFDAKMSNNTDVFYIGWANADSTQITMQEGVRVTDEYKRYSFTGQTTKTNINSFVISNYKGYGRGNGNNTTGVLSIKNIKLEEGSIATPWCPNSADTLATTMGLNSTTEYDCSGFCNNGIRNKTFTWTSDTPKYAVSQNFNNNHLIEAEGLPTETSTIACWIKWHTLPSGYTIPIHDKQSGLAIGLTNKTRLISYVGTGNGGSGSCVNVSLETNIWYHIVVVKTGTNTRKVYINGEEITSMAANNYWGGDLNKFLVGGRHISGSYSNYIDGQICDVRAYATALSASDVKSLYQNCATIDPDGTIRGQIRS